MAVENFTTYTEADPNTRITKTATRITCAALTLNEDAWVYKDKTAGYFDGDFIHYLTVRYTAGNAYGRVYPWGITNAIDDMYAIDAGAGSYLGLMLNIGSPNKYQITLEEIDSGTQYTNGYTNLSVDTTYYLSIKRDESVGTHGTLYCYIYSDASRQTLIDTLTLTLHSSKKDFQYMFGLNTWKSAGAGDVSIYSENLELMTPAVVTTQAVSAVSNAGGTGNGNITSLGGGTVSAHGHCWSTSPTPDLTDSYKDNGAAAGTGAFTTVISGIFGGTKYYVRSFATNEFGTSYGNEVTFTTISGGVPSGLYAQQWVWVDWDADGDFGDTYETITDDVLSIPLISYGKDRELGEAVPADLQVIVDNYDYKYNRTNAASPLMTGGNTIRAGHLIRAGYAFPYDDFTDEDAVALANHTIPRDSSFAWTEQSGTWLIDTNAVKETTGAGIATVDFDEYDCPIQVTFTKGANDDGVIVFRFKDTNNFLYIRTDGTNLEVRKVEGGADTLVKEETLAWANDATKTIKVILHGKYIWVFADLVQVISTESTFQTTETEHGIGGASIDSGARYDTFGGFYSLFYGTIDEIEPSLKQKTATITASDDLKLLNKHTLYRRAYAYAGYPGGIRQFIREVYKNTANVAQLGDIMDAGETVSSSPYKSWWGITGLFVCRSAEKEENGLFYQDMDAQWRFEAKGHRAATPHDVSRCIIYTVPETNNIYCTDLNWRDGEDDVKNIVSVHVQKSFRDPTNRATSGQEVWRCAEADVVDGGIGSSALEIPASSAIEIYMESDFETVEDLITPSSTRAEEKLAVNATGGAIVGGPFLLGEQVKGLATNATGEIVEVGGGYIIVGELSGNLTADEKIQGQTSLASLNDGAAAGGTTITDITDYVANASANGGGADKTGNLTVALAYPVYASYGKGAKITLTNSDTSAIYVTKLRVRGDAYNLQSLGSVLATDATSQGKYGEQSYNVDAILLTTLAEAKTLADDVEGKEDDPRSKIIIAMVNGTKKNLQKILGLQISDRVTLNDATNSGINEDFYINKKVLTLSEAGMIVNCIFTLEEVA